MKKFSFAVHTVLLLAATNVYLIGCFLTTGFLKVLCPLLCIAAFIYVNLYPVVKPAPVKHIWYLSSGTTLLRLFCVTATVNFLWMLVLLVDGWSVLTMPFIGTHHLVWMILLLNGLVIIVLEALLFWNGMIRVYITSVQLGLKHRVLAALCGWIPGLNLWYLFKIIRITADEAEFETEKWELDEVRAENAICKTKYPVLMVHGVFFRDFRYLNYWGRVPRELQRNGATVYYGQQQSAASVEDAGRELAERIRQLVAETGCEKVNIVAHSKGGLDARAAISHQGCAPYVATLTTINTPHRGCIFAEQLFHKAPEGLKNKLAGTYNAALQRLGDASPDFLAAVSDLTESACLARNETTPDAPEVVYESVMSYCKRARNGKFPLNVSYPIVRHFDGQNDGLVSVESAEWGGRFTLLEPSGKRGISHGDVIDLNRENIQGYDVREFYVNLISALKERGF